MPTKEMKAIAIDRFGGVEQLKIHHFPIPAPSDNEVQIQVIDAAVNPVDWKIREGKLSGRLPHEFPLILGWDAAGIISAVGKDVKNFKIGDEVFAYCRKPIVKWGTYAEYVCVEAQNVAAKPKKLSFAQAAAIPLVGLTAWQSLFDVTHLKKGETVLIPAGAGGVGSIAIAFAKNAGAKVITTASQPNHAYVKSLGADVAIDYTKDNVLEKVKGIAPQGVDVVFDTVGGKSYLESFQMLKPGGRIVSLLEQPNADAEKKYQVKASYHFVMPNGEQLKKIAQLIDEGKVPPPHIEEVSWEKAADAQTRLQEGHTKGKIVLKIVK